MIFILVLAFLIISASIIAIFVRIEDREERGRLKNDDFSADDFEIIE